MPSAEKIEKVAGLKGRIEASNALLLAEFRGLSVHDATELRRSLSDQARFSVVKNTMMARAATEAGIEQLGELLSGPTAVAFVQGDVVTAAKKVVDAAKRFPALVLKGAYMEGKVLGPAEAQALATLESREVMLSRIAGLMKSEMTRAASAFQALQSQFLGLLEAYREKLAPEVPEVPEVPEPETPAARAEEPEAPAARAEEPEAAEPAQTAEEPDTAEPAETESPAAEPEAPAEEPEADVDRTSTAETGEDEDAPAEAEANESDTRPDE
jgi:large subunit ribosomal protein L10